MFAHVHKAARQVELFDRLAELLLHLRGGILAGAFDARDLLKTNGQGPRAHPTDAVQRYQQGSLHKAQAQHQVEMKGGRQRIALKEGLLDASSGLAQAGIVDGHPDEALRAERQSPFQDGPKQLLGIPLATGE